MLRPAELYTNEIQMQFAKDMYTEDYFYYFGYAHCSQLPNMEREDGTYRYAIVDSKENLIGYMGYHVDTCNDCVSKFGIYSFNRGNCIIGKDLYEKMEEIVSTHHRVEWCVLEGNPVKKHYDWFCEKHNGTVHHFRDVVKDDFGVYHDEYVYEIVSDYNVSGHQ